MVIKNGRVLIGNTFVETDIQFEKNIIAIGKLEEPGNLDAAGEYIIPGLVDIHTHGAMGEDFSDGKPSGLQPLADYYAVHGVTSYLATTMTLKEDVLIPAMSAIRNFRPSHGAKCAGIHLEGPFLCYAKRGAQAAESLHKPDAALFHRLNEASGGRVRLVTVACEEEGAIPFIQEVSQVCTVSLGHTVADYDTAMAGFAAGATHATHLYNGMPAFLHRAPGVIGAAFDVGASVELICDGLHIHPSVIRATHQLFGDRLNLISDSLRCAGMPDGDYELGGQTIVVKDGRATLLDGTIAGSSISLLDAVRNVVRFGIPLAAAVYAASTAPARRGRSQGSG
ncbi:MAG: N-acetylglucosamine-6-phosphate deacetylase [Oscillospiraceae bacterium]|nr:N-acetylglucosamine-6-phosphate deacetylase [Oscillospiraceae bacterium]